MVCPLVLVAGCAASDDSSTSAADWCWRYYDLAPSEALASDLGPPSADSADAWLTWLTATVDAPAARRSMQREQLRLVNVLDEAGRWSSLQRERYRRASTADPTPATVCETLGARIIPEPDGSLPEGWMDRFVDPDDPAFSSAARSQMEAQG